MKWLILLVSIFLLFYRLGSNHLSNWDEAWYAGVSRNMVVNNNFLTPIWNTKPFFEKPPLYYWTSAMAMKVFGINEFSARLPSALAGVGCIYLTYLLATFLFKKESVGVTAMLILTSTIGFLYRSRTGNMDTLLAFWLLLAIYGFFKIGEIGEIGGDKGDSRNWGTFPPAGRAGIPGIFSLGIIGTFLTKGMIALAFPAIIMVVWAITKTKYLSSICFRRFILGVIWAIGTIGVWFALFYFVNGSEFLRQFWFQQGEKIGGIGDIRGIREIGGNFNLDYIIYLLHGMKIWAIVAIPSTFYALIKLRKEKSFVLPLFIVLLLAGYSFMGNKSDWYLVPLYPILAIISGWGIGEIILKIKYKILNIEKIVILILIITAGGLVYHYADQYITPDVAGDEARAALAARELTLPSDTLYLTNYYYPTTVYYSQRLTYAVYSEQEVNPSWWVLPKTSWPEITKQDRVFVLTTREEWGFNKEYLPDKQFKVLYKSGEKLLISKSTNKQILPINK